MEKDISVNEVSVVLNIATEQMTYAVIRGISRGIKGGVGHGSAWGMSAVTTEKTREADATL